MDAGDDPFLFQYVPGGSFRSSAVGDGDASSGVGGAGSVIDSLGEYGLVQPTPATPSMAASGMLGMMGAPQTDQSMFPAMSAQAPTFYPDTLLTQGLRRSGATPADSLSFSSGLNGSNFSGNMGVGPETGPKMYGATLQGALSGLVRKGATVGPPGVSGPSYLPSTHAIQGSFASSMAGTGQQSQLGNISPQLLAAPQTFASPPQPSIPFQQSTEPTSRVSLANSGSDQAQMAFRQHQAERLMKAQLNAGGLSRSDAAANAAAAMASIMVEGQYGMPLDDTYRSPVTTSAPSMEPSFEQTMDVAVGVASAINDYYVKSASGSNSKPKSSGPRQPQTQGKAQHQSSSDLHSRSSKGAEKPQTASGRPSRQATTTAVVSANAPPSQRTKMTVMGPVPIQEPAVPPQVQSSQAAPQQQKKVKAGDANKGGRSATAAAAEGSTGTNTLGEGGNGPVAISRHINSVINHFTSSKEGYRRLLQELDDLLFVLTPEGLVIYASPSAKRTLGFTQDELVGKPILDVCHPDDAALVTEELESSVRDAADSAYHARFVKKTGEIVLMEVRGKPYGKEQLKMLGSKDISSGRGGFSNGDDADPVAPGEIRFVVNTAREYRSKASLAVDGILELSVENLKLRRQLEKALKEKGIDPSTHPLLKEAENELPPPSMLPSELFDAAGLDMKEKIGFGDSDAMEGVSGPGASTAGEGAPFVARAPAGEGEKKKVSRQRV